VSPVSSAEDAERVYPELWISFASLLKVYTAAHGLNSGIEAEVECNVDVIEIQIPGRNRSLRFELRGADGTWTREDGTESRFSLLLNGNMIVNTGTEEEMDTIAERLAREIMR
jgi:hypothetical protein